MAGVRVRRDLVSYAFISLSPLMLFGFLLAAVGVVAGAIPHLIGTTQCFWKLRRHVDRRVLLSFGITGALGGLAGALSGVLGGLVGSQGGGIRSAAMLRFCVRKEVFVATASQRARSQSCAQ